MKQIRDLILYEISQPLTIVLAVSAGEEELAKSQALEILGEVQKNNDQDAFGVITKIDLIDNNERIFKTLNNCGFSHRTKLGVCGVILNPNINEKVFASK